ADEISRRFQQLLARNLTLTSRDSWSILQLIWISLSEPSPEISRPAFVAAYGGSLNRHMKISSQTEDPIYWASVYRTTAVNFRLSAEALHPGLELRDDGSPAKLTAIPFYFLVSHAIELFLKSALLKRGYVPADLRRLDNRHNLRALLELLKKKGLPVSAEATSII